MDKETQKAFDKIQRQLEAVREALKKSKEETLHHFDVVAENIHRDVAGANHDEISLMQNKHKHLEERVNRIEEKIGV